MGAARALPPLSERFWAKVKKTDGCWLWGAAITTTGYGVIRVDGVLQKAHRVAYELAVAPIPAGMQIDHVCHNRPCVNPAHLRIATNKENAENRSGAQANSRSGVRGVHWFKPYGKWRVEVGHHGRNHHGGYFEDLEDAARAAKALRASLFTHDAGEVA
jgi:hypothetical protein